MINLQVGMDVGNVKVMATTDRTHTPEEWAAMAAARIISVGNNSHPAIRDQAHAFKQNIEKVVAYYIEQAIRSDRALRK